MIRSLQQQVYQLQSQQQSNQFTNKSLITAPLYAQSVNIISTDNFVKLCVVQAHIHIAPLIFDRLINDNEPVLGRHYAIRHRSLNKTAKSSRPTLYRCIAQFAGDTVGFTVHQLFLNELSMLNPALINNNTFLQLLQQHDIHDNTIFETWSDELDTDAVAESDYKLYYRVRIQPAFNATFGMLHTITGCGKFVANSEDEYNVNDTGIKGRNSPDTMTHIMHVEKPLFNISEIKVLHKTFRERDVNGDNMNDLIDELIAPTETQTLLGEFYGNCNVCDAIQQHAQHIYAAGTRFGIINLTYVFMIIDIGVWTKPQDR